MSVYIPKSHITKNSIFSLDEEQHLGRYVAQMLFFNSSQYESSCLLAKMPNIL